MTQVGVTVSGSLLGKRHLDIAPSNVDYGYSDSGTYLHLIHAFSIAAAATSSINPSSSFAYAASVGLLPVLNNDVADLQQRLQQIEGALQHLRASQAAAPMDSTAPSVAAPALTYEDEHFLEQAKKLVSERSTGERTRHELRVLIDIMEADDFADVLKLR